MKKSLYAVLLALLLVSFIGPWGTPRANSLPAMTILSATKSKMDAGLGTRIAALQQNETITVIVMLKQQADLSRVVGADKAARGKGVIRALQGVSNATQRRVKNLLSTRLAEGSVKDFKPLWVFNGFSVTATSDVIDELAQQTDVLSISPDVVEIVPALGSAEPNIALSKAPSLWNLGYMGQGVVVASMDSGVNVNHPDLAGRWRGGFNGWYDPYGQHPATPTDISGHGTLTMGVIVGGDAGGTTVGVAPGAQWIAVKMFDDAGVSTATAIHLGFQWLLDPDNDPATDDSPNVVNNSWTYANPGCYLDFEPDLQALRAAGILPIFAAGNGGPLSNTSFSPGNNPSAFAVGAINNKSQIYGYSSRGPTTCGGSSGPFPKLVAPGVNVRTTDLFGGYSLASGTSLASPHVAGGLALLLSAYPNLTVDDQQNALISSAIDLGAVGADNIYGYGRLDILGAFNSLGSLPTPTAPPSNTVTPTSTDTPTLTSTPLPTFTSVPSNTPTSLPTFTSTPSNTPTPLPSFTSTPGNTPTFTPLPTNTAAATFTLTPEPTFTSTPSATPTPLPTFTVTPSNTPTTAPTFTPLPTNTATPVPTFTATVVASTSMHSGDLDRSSTGSGAAWSATVTIRVHDHLEQPVANATVTGQWSNGANGTSSCVTDFSGVCTVTKAGLKNNRTSVAFGVTNITKPSFTYSSTSNHDPDGESNGTTIVILKP